MKIVYDRIADRLPLSAAAHRREADIGAVFDGEPGVEVRWELHTERVPRELVLVAEDEQRRAEESITVNELIDGNGTFHEKLRRMRDSLKANGHWRVGVRKLMGDAEQWATEMPGATVERFTVTLNEEHFGRYELPALLVRFGPRTVRIVPLSGRNVPPTWLDELRPETQREIGCVQFDGSEGSLEVYLLFPSGKWVYQDAILDGAYGLQGYQYLDKQGFQKLVRECTDE